MSDHDATIGGARRVAKAGSGHARGVAAEALAAAALTADGFVILGRRLRTPCGEIDLVAATATWLVFVEVKLRRDLALALVSLRPRQQARLLGAAEILLASHPEWARESIRFDVIVVDDAGQIRRVMDAFRIEN